MTGRRASIGRAALDFSVLLSIALLAGRVSGLLREIQLAATLGASTQADIAVLLLTVPDLLVNLLLAGGLSAALVPRLRALTEEQGAALVRRCAGIVFAGSLVAALILAGWPAVVFALLAPGLEMAPAIAGNVAIFAVAFAIVATALSGVTTAYLNARDRYLIAGCGTLIFNLVVVTALAVPASLGSRLTVLGLGVAAGAAIRLSTQAAIIEPRLWRRTTAERVPDPEFIRAFVAGMLATGLALLAPVIVRAAASLLGTGAIAAFNYAQKIVELPAGILITTISTVALTRLSALHALGALVEARTAALRDIQRGLAISAAVVVIGIAFADSFVALALGRGAMDASAVVRVIDLTRIALLGVPWVALSSMAGASLNARLMPRAVLHLTGVALLALPIFVAPGLILGSETALMGAVVLFQAVLAVLLLQRADLHWLGNAGVFNRSAVVPLGTSLLLSAAVVLIDRVVGLESDLARLFLGGTGFVLAVAIGFRARR